MLVAEMISMTTSHGKVVAELNNNQQVKMHCPGCNMTHLITVNPKSPVKWGFNNDFIKPTFSPSLKVTYTWGEEQTEHCCHSFIRDGQWQFLSDCTHSLAGQTVPAIPLDEVGTT